MVHHLKRGIIAGIILWILIFAEVSILMYGFGLERGMPNYYFVHFILLAVFIIGTSLWWFKSEDRRGFKEGIVIGVLFVIVTTLLDSFITVPIFIKEYSFFSDWDILTGAIMMIIIPAIVGAVIPRGKGKTVEKTKIKKTEKMNIAKTPAKIKPVVKKPVKVKAVKPVVEDVKKKPAIKKVSNLEKKLGTPAKTLKKKK